MIEKGKALRIVTDGAGDFPPGWREKYDIHVIPINIQFGEKTYLQGLDLSDEAFYQLADESGVIPKTSQPSPYQFVQFYRKIAQQGDTVLSLHVTSKLSGTLDSAIAAAKELAGKIKVIPFDSGNGSAGMAYMCREAREMERAGSPLESILKRLEQIRKQIRIVLTLDSLDYARMSGRVKALQAALATMLNVKPIVELREGILEIAGRVRTRQKALNHVLEAIRKEYGDRRLNVAVVHAQDPKSGEQLLQRVRQMLNCDQLVLTNLSIAVAANLGPGTVGIIAYPVEG
jgi:DegV family protein with EDD domain